MSYLNHLSVIANGGMPGGERWSCSLSFGNLQNLASSPEEVQAQAQACTGPWSTFFDAGGALIPGGVSLQRVDVRSIGTDGKTVFLGQAAPSGTVTGAGAASLPNQCAIVLSLRTRAAGPKGRGRMYIPALKATVGSDGRIPPTQRETFAAFCLNLITGLQTAINVPSQTQQWVPVVASGVGAGANNLVTAIRVGDVIDTQRRRRDALSEAYTQSPLPI